MSTLVAEFHPGLLHFTIRQQPNEGLVVQVDDLDAISPGIAKVTAKSGNQLETILVNKLFANFDNLGRVADHNPEMGVAALRDHALVLKHRQELVLAEFEEGSPSPSSSFSSPKTSV
jgi:hypothetical protein